MDFIASLDGFKALLIRGWDWLILVDPSSAEKQISTSVDNMESTGYLHGPNGQVEVDVMDNKGYVSPNPDSSIDYSMILS